MNSNNVQTISARKILDEVSFIRPILIVLLVLYHSLCLHTGKWKPINGMEIIPFYRDLGLFVYSFMLEAFVFVSGYVWSYQRKGKDRKENLWSLVIKKGLRLIVPTLLFGLLYIYLFQKDGFSVLHLIEGPGHLWFLPMLFWCFVIGWCILRFKISPKVVLPLLFIISIVRPIGFPLRFSYTLYYLFFFFIGYYTYSKYQVIKSNVNKWQIYVSWILFVTLYAGGKFVTISLSVGYRGGQVVQIFYSMAGVWALYVSAVYLTGRSKINEWYYKIGSLCMGVYIFQQFILKGLYYHTTISSRVDNWSLPIIAFTIALLMSLFLAYIIRLSKIGKKIL